MIDLKKDSADKIMNALIACENNDVVKRNPCDIILPKRMDIIIRYMAGQELLMTQNGMGIEMYERWLELSHHTHEAIERDILTRYFSDYSEKDGFECYCSSFLSLLKSMDAGGFDKKYFIPLDSEYNPINGAHRLAAALIFNQEVYVKRYECFRTGWNWSCGRLASQGFSVKELLCLISTYLKIVGNGLTFVVPCSDDGVCDGDFQRLVDELRKKYQYIGQVLCTYDISEKLLEKSILDIDIFRGYSEKFILYAFSVITPVSEVLESLNVNNKILSGLLVTNEQIKKCIKEM